MKTLIVIPARLASSRLPQKMLADIGGHPMLWHVYQRCLQVTQAQEVHIVTDAEPIAEQANSWGATVWMSDPHCGSGTERIVAILPHLNADLILNVQGDQPLLSPKLVDQLISAFANLHPQPDIITPIFPLHDEASIFNPNLVKVVLGHGGEALYFSRHPIPYVRELPPTHWSNAVQFWGHIGIYGYRREVLEHYSNLPNSPLEQAEKLEQLRFLQAGKRILTVVTELPPISVDVPTDLEQVRMLYAQSLSMVC